MAGLTLSFTMRDFLTSIFFFLVALGLDPVDFLIAFVRFAFSGRGCLGVGFDDVPTDEGYVKPSAARSRISASASMLLMSTSSPSVVSPSNDEALADSVVETPGESVEVGVREIEVIALGKHVERVPRCPSADLTFLSLIPAEGASVESSAAVLDTSGAVDAGAG